MLMVVKVIPQPIWFKKHLCENVRSINILVYGKQLMAYTNDISKTENS